MLKARVDGIVRRLSNLVQMLYKMLNLHLMLKARVDGIVRRLSNLVQMVHKC